MPEAEDFSCPDNLYMEMPSGKRWYMDHPTFDLEDIAYSLANQNRFNGTGRRFMSVAEHSVRVSYLINEYQHMADGGLKVYAIEGLVHDVPEAYLGDVPGPWKALLPDFVKLEQHIWRHFIMSPMMIKHNLSEKHTTACKFADWRALFIEAREIMPTQGRDWATPDYWQSVHATVNDPPCWFWSPAEAEERFILRFHELTW
jgi:hypothetical protein